METETEKEKEKGSTLEMDYEIEVRDKNGKLLELQRGKSHTWVRAFIRFMAELFANTRIGDRTFTMLDTSGTSRTVWAGSGNTSQYHVAFGAKAAATASYYGIQVGSSDAPYSRDQYCLQALIGHGTGAGQLLYGDTTVEGVTLEDSTERFRIVRSFTNSSGSSVTVKEIGLTVFNQYGSTTYYYLFARDVLPSPISVPDGASLTVRYRIFVSYA